MVEKKKFFEVELPLINDKAELLAYSAESLNGKTIKIDLTRRLRGKSLEAVFKISFDNGLKAKMTRISLFGYFIRRMMRKSISYIEDSFFVECKNAVLRIKPYMLTRQKVSRKVINGIRKKAKEEILNELKNMTYEEIFSDIISNKFQRTLSSKVKKVYPLSFCEIRDIFVVKEKNSEVKTEKV